jgi:rhodanese-related sulfurtransferase
MTAARRSIDEVLAQARAGLVRLDPPAAVAAVAAGGVLVDTRPVDQRVEQGEIPGAVVVARTALEWRLDPASPYRLSLADYDLHVVVVCAQGYSSSLAAASLQQLGVHRATDLAGGFRAWAAAGLPTVPYGGSSVHRAAEEAADAQPAEQQHRADEGG